MAEVYSKTLPSVLDHGQDDGAGGFEDAAAADAGTGEVGVVEDERAVGGRGQRPSKNRVRSRAPWTTAVTWIGVGCQR